MLIRAGVFELLRAYVYSAKVALTEENVVDVLVRKKRLIGGEEIEAQLVTGARHSRGTRPKAQQGGAGSLQAVHRHP